MKGIIVCRLLQFEMRAYYKGCILCVSGCHSSKFVEYGDQIVCV